MSGEIIDETHLYCAEKDNSKRSLNTSIDSEVNNDSAVRLKKTKGKLKLDMNFIENKNKRFTTFCKRKNGIMKKAYELSTLTGSQIMVLVASETGHVYTFATSKLKPMITSVSGKTLIQTCLNAPDSVNDHLTDISDSNYVNDNYNCIVSNNLVNSSLPIPRHLPLKIQNNLDPNINCSMGHNLTSKIIPNDPKIQYIIQPNNVVNRNFDNVDDPNSYSSIKNKSDNNSCMTSET